MAVKMNEVILLIRKLCDDKNWSLYRLSKESGVPYSSITNMYKRNNQPTIFNLDKICQGLDIPLWKFFYILNEDPMDSNHSLNYNESENNLIDTYRRMEAYEKEIVDLVFSLLPNGAKKTD